MLLVDLIQVLKYHLGRLYIRLMMVVFGKVGEGVRLDRITKGT